MKEKTKNINKKHNYQLRAKLPLVLRASAAVGLAVTVLIIGVGFYWGSSNREFRLKPGDTQLSKEVIGVVNGYERRESENGVSKYYLKADKATTFSDNHKELENVYLEVFDRSDPDKLDKLTAKKAIYIPVENTKDFRIYFAGDVNIKTRHGLEVKSEQISYEKKTEIAESEVEVEFKRENISGKALGAIINIKERTLELLEDVEIVAMGTESSELADANVRHAKIKSGHAFVEQVSEKIIFEKNVEIELIPHKIGSGRLSQPTDIKANKATAFFEEQEITRIELEGNVDVFQKPTSVDPSWMKTKAHRAIATVDKELTKLDLYENVVIEMAANRSKRTLITSNSATYDQVGGKVHLEGSVIVKQGGELVRGDVIDADLTRNKQIKYVRSTGHAFLRQKAPERITEIAAEELNATFTENQHIKKANSIGNSEVIIVPSKFEAYTKLRLFAVKAINLDFRSDGTLSKMKTQGRTTLNLNAPNNSPVAADKTLSADKINTILRRNGKELENATAIGKAVLIVDPLRKSPKNYRTTINAPRFDCNFFEKNNVRTCTGGTGTKTVRIPTDPNGTRGQQTLIAKTLNAVFSRQTSDIKRFDAVGKAKFIEGDRNGVSETIVYTANDRTVRLKGGSPTVWDSHARVRAGEIDWNTSENRSAYRGGVRATYYSQKKTGDATPFRNVNSPVFVTSRAAKFDHDGETAVFTGNSRAWQDKNYVRAEKLTLDRKRGWFDAEGKVQSALYEMERTLGGKKTKTTVYASANKMTYRRNKNLLRYEEKVDIRQGSDRIVGGIAIIYLTGRMELSQTIIERNVVITQPNRRASGDYAKYSASDEIIVLRGNPAKVSDSKNGSSSGRELMVNLRTNRVTGKGKASKNSRGRIRTIYKIKDGKLN